MTRIAPNPPEPERPTRVRYTVLAFACTLAMIVYLDRACVASAASSIIKELGLASTAALGPVYAAFALAYAIFEVPNGWLGDRFGPRKVLIRIAVWWSVFVALSGVVGLAVGGWVLGFGMLVAVQFLAGVGEAGAFPNITRMLHNWFPYHQRAAAQGAMWMCGRLMGGLTPLVWTLLVAGVSSRTTEPGGEVVMHTILSPLLSWRAAFWLFGLLGVVWCAWFTLWFRDRPEQKRQVNAAELALIRAGPVETGSAHAAVPWGAMLRSPNLWLLCLMYACQCFGWYFYMTYLPKFFEQNLEVPASSLQGAVLKGGPLWMGAVGCMVGGLVSDRFTRRTGSRRWGRRISGLISHTLTALCFAACAALCSLQHSPLLFFLAISFAGFSTDLAMGPAWACCQDIGRRYAAIMAGCMNMFGNLGGAMAGWVFGRLLDRSLHAHARLLDRGVELLTETEKAAGLWNGYQLGFLVAAGLYVVGVLCWLRIDASRALVEEGEPGS